ncbi:MAG: energy transducer TonB [Flavobacteriales bacterium]|nr:MAG: energy transducer TonB [Flavobacteriales bacterium]
MRLPALLLLALPLSLFAQSDTPVQTQDTAPEVVLAPDSNAALVFAEQMPEFPGGQQAMMDFLRKHVRYPEPERENEVQGTVYVRFVVDKSGKVRDAEVLRGVPKGPGLGEEALRVVQMMPDWLPGTQLGKPVHVQFNLPVKFTLK